MYLFVVFRLQKDAYYDYEREELDVKKEQDKKQKQARQSKLKTSFLFRQ